MRARILTAAQCRIMNIYTSGSPYNKTHSGYAVVSKPLHGALQEQDPVSNPYKNPIPREMTGG